MSKKYYASWKADTIFYTTLWLIGDITAGSILGGAIKATSVFVFLFVIKYVFAGIFSVSDWQALKRRGWQSIAFGIGIFLVFIIYGLTAAPVGVPVGSETANAMGLPTLAVFLSLLIVGAICLGRARSLSKVRAQ